MTSTQMVISAAMRLVERVKAIMLRPSSEWPMIEKEPSTLTGLRWTVVALKEGRGAKSALDRITIPPEVLDRLMPSPRSSLIISDEELSAETGKEAELVVSLSGEPQRAIKSRRRGSGI